MPDTLPDIEVPINDWVNLDTVAGLTPGTEIQVQNKSSYPILLFLQSAKPSINSLDGEVLNGGGELEIRTIGQAQNDVWAKSLGLYPAKLSVRAV